MVSLFQHLFGGPPAAQPGHDYAGPNLSLPLIQAMAMAMAMSSPSLSRARVTIMVAIGWAWVRASPALYPVGLVQTRLDFGFRL
ncbi:hypothetical protein AMTR_s00069p00125930 [Amborella trichopoda]|uniref:Uncharacterized protein n=1 Tax=Amborella trichopoda TaxID=13333 RepID=U5DG10_AMBTC|nr:hypothetical protein AMTR_s00069p00125930 [Amborella trichopoda]